jgi:hypothetical protein
MKNNKSHLATVGWREWVSLPELGLPAIKAKIDTGARTSALHAFSVERYKQEGEDRLRFHMHPVQRDTDTVIVCDALLKDEREVTDSGGHTELRYVIETELHIGGAQWPIEMTLTNRDNMRFRMLIGREALKNKLLVDSSSSYLLSGDGHQ